MNMRKALPLLVIASMMISLIPSVMINAALTNTLSVSSGPVGTSVTITGTLNTYNGRYKITIDSDNDGTFGTDELGGLAIEDLAGVVGAGQDELRASGYSFSQTIEVPDAYQGARKIRVTDLDAAGQPTVDAFFTVQTTYSLESDEAMYYEGGGVGPAPAGVVFTGEIFGAPQAWAAGIDLQYRIKVPGGAMHSTPWVTVGATEGNPGHYTDATATFGPQDAELATVGTYTAYLDYDETGTATWKTGKATTTFAIKTTDKIEYERTLNTYMETLVPAGKTLDKIEVIDSTGANVAPAPLAGPLGVAAGAWLGPTLLLTTAKDSSLGSYTVKLYDIGGSVYKTQVFTVKKAAIAFTVPLFQDQSAQTGVVGPIGVGTTVERMHDVEAYFQLQYPDGSLLTSADLPNGFSVKVHYNNTIVATVTLNPLTDYNALTNTWLAAWTIPKDAKLGTNYEFNVTDSSVTDDYGNMGPDGDYGTRTIAVGNDNFFEVIAGTLYITSGPTLSYPANLTPNFQVTSTAKALVEVKYADNTRFTGSDLTWFNFTVTDGANDNDFNAASADYSSDVGMWVLKGKIPYDAVLGAGYGFTIPAGSIEDKWGNTGDAAGGVTAGTFTLVAASITISDFAVSATSVESDDQLTVTFKATYTPSGDVVTTRDVAPFPRVTFYDADGNVVATVRAGYVGSSQKWSASWIVPAGTISGTYNATIDANDFVDETTTNMGPTVMKYANFDVSRVSLTDVKAASDAAKASADLAQTKADAAKTAADSAATKADAAAEAADDAKTAATAAGTKADAATAAANSAKTSADGAKTAADSAAAAATAAGTKADAATTAANNAKTAADSAAAAANGLTTLVYAAIGASLVAALAAIVALMQISRKIA